jgi:hypothetical protein
MSKYTKLFSTEEEKDTASILNVKINSIHNSRDNSIGKPTVERPKDTVEGSPYRKLLRGSEEGEGEENAETLYAIYAVSPGDAISSSPDGGLSETEREALQALRDITPEAGLAELANCDYRWRWACAGSDYWQRSAEKRGVPEEDFYPAAQSLLDRGLVEHSHMRLPDFFGIPGGVLPAGWEHIRDCFRDRPYPPAQTKIRRQVIDQPRPGVYVVRMEDV